MGLRMQRVREFLSTQKRADEREAATDRSGRPERKPTRPLSGRDERRARVGRAGVHTWAPSASYSTVIEDELRDEAATIESVLRQYGELDRVQLREKVGARYWGPGSFAKTLAQMAEAGIVRRVRRDRFALTEEAIATYRRAGVR
jgi:hypothetical protein